MQNTELNKKMIIVMDYYTGFLLFFFINNKIEKINKQVTII